MAIHQLKPGHFCVDQVYYLPNDVDDFRHGPLFEDFLGEHSSREGMIRYCIDEGIITQSGLYIIVRLDTTLSPGAHPCMMWWGMVDIDDGAVGINPGKVGSPPAPTPRLTTWPPKN